MFVKYEFTGELRNKKEAKIANGIKVYSEFIIDAMH